MVGGIGSFRTHFADYKDRYVLIGGTASTLAMEELGANFRATKDLDIVLCVEALDKEFARKFWDFVQLGGYENRQRSTGKRLFYRFYSPKDPNFPEMLELFSRIPDALQVVEGAQLTPIPVGSEVSSLSAILLDDAYYKLIHSIRGAAQHYLCRCPPLTSMTRICPLGSRMKKSPSRELPALPRRTIAKPDRHGRQANGPAAGFPDKVRGSKIPAPGASAYSPSRDYISGKVPGDCPQW